MIQARHKTSKILPSFSLAVLFTFLSYHSLTAQTIEVLDPNAPYEGEDDKVPEERYQLVENFTALTLRKNEYKLGINDLDVGLDDSIMLGTDFLADMIGAPNLKLKVLSWTKDRHNVALGLRGAYVSRNTMLWGSTKSLFDRLEARIINPSISWTYHMSPRLIIHTHWGTGIGKIHATLSEKGKRRLWESKHPDDDYDRRDDEDGGTHSNDDSEEDNQEKNEAKDRPATFKQRTLMFSSVAGMLTEIFQITGEYSRHDRSKVLVISRVERVTIEDLKAANFRFTISQQWIWPNYQFRLGVGAQYLVITGNDLDGEAINEAGVLPAGDLDFYLRF